MYAVIASQENLEGVDTGAAVYYEDDYEQAKVIYDVTSMLNMVEQKPGMRVSLVEVKDFQENA